MKQNRAATAVASVDSTSAKLLFGVRNARERRPESPPALLRLSIGLEHPQDRLADLSAALALVPVAAPLAAEAA